MTNYTPLNDATNAYNEWHEKVHGANNAFMLDLQDWHRNALSLAPDLKTSKILEVGCGTGDFAIHLAEIGGDITAVDFSSRAIELAKEKARAHKRVVNFQVADAQSLPFADESFDVIFSCECLEHIPDPQSAFLEFNRVLRPSVSLFLTTENYSNAMLLAWIVCWYRGQPFNSGVEVQPIEHFFLFWRLKRMFKRSGFHIRNMAGSHHVFLLLPRFHPHTFVVEYFHNSVVAKLLRPFARHMTFAAVKE